MKVREVIEFIEVDGWYLVATRVSHRQYKNRINPAELLFLENCQIHCHMEH